MAEYINIRGQNVEVLASDPANPTVGQIWYNSTSNTLKGSVYSAGSVASGGNLNVTRRGVAGAGTQTAALAFSGYTGTTPTASTESYNGTTWTNVTGLPTAVYNTGGTGTQTAALAFGGNLDPGVNAATNLWNGSSWTAGAPPSYPTGMFEAYGAGTQTATITCGLRVNPGGHIASNELWNGTSWTTSPGLNESRSSGGTAGNSTSALVYGGEAPPGAPYGLSVEEWNGSAWSTQNTKSVATKYGNNGPIGTVPTAISFGGLDFTGTAVTTIEEYNGTTWSTSPVTLPTGKGEAGGAGSYPAALYSGGNSPASVVNTSFEFIGAGPQTQTITSS